MARPGVRVHHYDTSAARHGASVEAALRELGTDHLDLLLVHRWDPLLDAVELAEACAREQGLKLPMLDGTAVRAA